MLHKGRVLAQGAPATVSRLADGRIFLVTPPTRSGRATSRRACSPGPTWSTPCPKRGVCGGADHARGGGRPAPDWLRRADARPFRRRLHDPASRSAPAEPAPLAAMGENVPTARRGRRGEAEVRGEGADAPFRRLHRRGQRLLRGRAGRDFRTAGPNGAGKTTTFRMLCGLLAVSERRVVRRPAPTCAARAPRRGAGSAMWRRNFPSTACLSVAREPRLFRQRLRPARARASARESSGR